MRRLLSILLLAAFAMPVAAPAFALDSRELPACCRRTGAHHCAMGMGGDAAAMQGMSGTASRGSVSEKTTNEGAVVLAVCTHCPHPATVLRNAGSGFIAKLRPVPAQVAVRGAVQAAAIRAAVWTELGASSPRGPPTTA